MIIYGYAFDTTKLSKSERRSMYDNQYFECCRPTGGGDPSAAVFGVKIDYSSFLFNPVSLASLKTEPTDSQKAELQREWDKVPEVIRNKADNPTPDVFVFDSSDD